MATLYSAVQATPDASETVEGKLRIATNAEGLAGTNDTTAMTPLKTANAIAASSSGVTGGLVYRGSYDATANSPVLTSAAKGDFYIVSAAGALAGQGLNIGDHIVFNQDASSPITAAMFDTIDNTDAVSSVNSQTGAVVLTAANVGALASGDNVSELVNDSGYLTSAPVTSVNSQTGVVTLTATNVGALASGDNVSELVNDSGYITSNLSASITVDTDGAYDLGTESAGFDKIYGNLEGAVCFKASNASGSQITKGQPVYISGVSGDVPEVSLADADAAAMPSAGLAGETANAGAEIRIITFGNLEGVNTSSYSLGDTLYIDTTAGALTATAPAGEAAKLQNIGKVIRVHATEGVIKVGGAGRSAVTPNLDQDKIFLGDSNNRAVSTALSAVALSSFSNDLGLATVATTGAYSDLSGTPALGTAAALDAGTSASNVVQLDGSARLPAVDGSQLTNLPSGEGVDPTLTVLSNTTYTLSAGDAPGVHIWYGASNTSTFTVTLPDIASVLSTVVSTNGAVGPTFEVYIGRGQAGDITVSAADGIDLLGDGSVTYSTTQTVDSGQWIKIIGWYVSASTQRYLMDSAAQPRDAGLTSISGLTTAADQLIYTTASDTYTTASLTAAGRALLDDADATAQRATLGLGTSAPLDAGTSASNVVQLDGSARLPAVDGSQLTNLPSSGISNIVEDTTPQLGGDLDPNGFGIAGNLVPATVNNRSLGSSTAEWSDLYLGDGSKIKFGNDQDVELIHDPDDGLVLDLGVADSSHDPQFELKGQGAGSFGPRLTFTQESSSPAQYDRVGQIRFQGHDSAANLQDYGFIYGQVWDATAGAEAGKISILAYPASANTRGLHVEGVAGDSTKTKINIDHDGSTYGLHLNNTLVSSTAAELNLLDGGTSVGSSITIVDADGIIVNDGGATKLVPASDLKTYIGSGSGSNAALDQQTLSADLTIGAFADTRKIFVLTSSADRVVNLPAASSMGSGQLLDVKSLSNVTFTITPNGTDNLDGSSGGTLALNVQFSSVTLVCDGTDDWFIV